MKAGIILILTIILALLLRFYLLGIVPQSLNWDEASIGYDAYSILKTGRDQFGKFLPLSFQSLNDYKSPLYIYLTVAPVFLFGLNEFAVRLISAIAGTTSVLMIFYLCQELFAESRHRTKISLISAFFLAVSPWHIQFSRTAFDCNLATAFILTALFFFIKGVRKNRYLMFSSFFFCLSILSYHSAKIVALLLIIFFAFIYRREIQRQKLRGLIFAAILVPVLLVLGTLFVEKNSAARFITINAFRIDELSIKASLNEAIDHRSGHDLAGKILHNRRLVLSNYESFKTYGLNYINHFNPDFWFNGDEDNKNHAPGFGVLFSFQIILFYMGLLYVFKHLSQKSSSLLLGLLVISPMPSALVWTTSMANRANLMCVPIQILSAIGLISLFAIMKKHRRLTGSTVVVILLISLSFYLHQYFAHTNYYFAKDWFWEKKIAVSELNKIKYNYKQIIISRTRNDRPSLWLFYLKYDPAEYLKEGGSQGETTRGKEKFDIFTFGKIKPKGIVNDPKTLLVGYPEDFQPITLLILSSKTQLALVPKIIKTIYYPDKTVALQFAEKVFYQKILPYTKSQTK
jgi:4-amino-4-deoxy-L-arabinose transferase-like glycosyltransferase